MGLSNTCGRVAVRRGLGLDKRHAREVGESVYSDIQQAKRPFSNSHSEHADNTLPSNTAQRGFDVYVFQPQH